MVSHAALPDMFSLGLPIIEKIVRPIIVYVALVILLRVFGKRELAQLNPFDLVVLLSLSNTVQNAIIGDDNSVTGGLIGAATLLLVNYLVVRFLFGHRRLDQILEGSPTELVRDGEVIEKNMAKELITTAELDVVSRRQGFDGVSDIHSCTLEPGGAFIMKRKEPPPAEIRYEDLVARLEELTSEVKLLREGLTGK
jgi:uncharacterized membrane protein YcaP (DUF421 family)